MEHLQCYFMSSGIAPNERILRKLKECKSLPWTEKLWLVVFNFFLSWCLFCVGFFSYHKKNAHCISAKFFSSLLLITHSSPSALSSTVLFRSRSSRSSVAVIIVWTLYKFDGHSFTRFKNFLKMKQTPKKSAKIISYGDLSPWAKDLSKIQVGLN